VTSTPPTSPNRETINAVGVARLQSRVQQPVAGVGLVQASKENRVMTWLMLLAVLLAVSPSFLIELQRSDVMGPEEARVMAASIETWRGWVTRVATGEWSGEWLIPSLNVQPVWDKPPAVSWAQAGVLMLTARGEMTVEQLVLRARVVGVVFGLLTVAAVYWLGFSIGGWPTAFFAALVCGTSPVLIGHSRVGTGTIHQVSWVYLGIAAAVWATRPYRAVPSVWRQAIGWAACGLAMGMGVLAAGPVSYPLVVGPVLLVILLCPHRTSHLLGLLTAVLIGVLVIWPWFVYVNHQHPRLSVAWAGWMMGVEPPGLGDFLGLLGQGILWVLAGLLFWVWWLVGVVIHTFHRETEGVRLRMWLGWAVVLTAAVILVIWPEGGVAERASLLVPGFSVLVGYLFAKYVQWSSESRPAKSWKYLGWVHLGVLTLVSIGVSVWLWVQGRAMHDEAAGSPYAGPVPWVFAVGLAVILLGILGLSLHWMIKDYPGRVTTCWALWAVVLMSVVTIPVVRGPRARNSARMDVAALKAMTAGRPLYRADMTGKDMDPVLLLYWGEPIHAVRMEELESKVEGVGEFYVLAPIDADEISSRLTAMTDLRRLGLRLWMCAHEERGPDPVDGHAVE
jgi:hypothetical protein